MRWFLLAVVLLGMAACTPFTASAPAGARGHVAYIREGDLWVRELPDGAPRRLTDGGGYVAPVWSPSGQWVLVGNKEGFLTVRSDGSETRRLPAGASRAVWSPVEDVLAYLDGEGRPSVVEADSTGSRIVVEERNAGGPTWSPDGRWLAYTQGAPDRTHVGIWRVPVTGGQPQKVYGKRGKVPQCLILGPWVSGDNILFWDMSMCSASLTADGLPLMAVSPTSGMPPRKLVDAMLVYPDFLSVAPDGRLAAAKGSDRQTWTNKRVVAVNAKAGPARPISPQSMAAISPDWAPDASRIAFAAMPDIGPVGGGEPARQGMMKRRIWSAAPDGTDLRRLTDDSGYRDEAPRWTRDGGHILFCRLDRQTKASVWLVSASGGAPKKVDDIDAPESWFGYYGFVNCSGFFDFWGEPPVRQTAQALVKKSAARSRTEYEVERAVRQAVAALRADQEEDTPKRVIRSFVNEQSPVAQEALNDVMALALDDRMVNGPTVSDLRFLSIAVKGDRASVRFRESLSIRNPSHESGAGFEHAWELVRRDGQWFVTGLSTFPDSPQRKAATQAVASWLRPLEKGRAPALQSDLGGGPGILQEWAAKRQVPSVGQIQFWRMSEPHLAPAAEAATMARVTLRHGKDAYYLVFHLWNGQWHPASLRPAYVRPSGLY